MATVVRPGVPATRANMQFRRRHDGSHWCDGGVVPWLGRPATAYGDGGDGGGDGTALWSLPSIYDGPMGRRRPEQMQRAELCNRWRDYPGACPASDGRGLLVWRAFERILGPGAPERRPRRSPTTPGTATTT